MRSMMRMRIVLLCMLTWLTASLSLSAATTYTGSGGLIPADPLQTSGPFESSILIHDPGTIAAGNAVTVGLIGLQHTWSGDLVAYVSHYDLSNNLLGSAYLFYRIGVTGLLPDGASADFGDGSGGTDNYYFNTDYNGDIWAVAVPLSDTEAIPGASTDLIHFGQYFTSDSTGARNNFSYAFAGQSLAGTWTLSILDQAADNTGMLGTGWELTLEASAIPEPNYGGLTAVALAGILLVRRLLTAL